jgi:hypothetical protein
MTARSGCRATASQVIGGMGTEPTWGRLRDESDGFTTSIFRERRDSPERSGKTVTVYNVQVRGDLNDVSIHLPVVGFGVCPITNPE